MLSEQKLWAVGQWRKAKAWVTVDASPWAGSPVRLSTNKVGSTAGGCRAGFQKRGKCPALYRLCFRSAYLLRAGGRAWGWCEHTTGRGRRDEAR
jgi:hypothetical protein